MSGATTADPPAGGAGGSPSLLGGAPGGGAPPGGAPGGGAPAGGRDWLPEAYREDTTFRDIQNLEALAKGYKHAASLVGVDRNLVLRLPQAPDAPEWSEVWKRLGRPDAPDGYKLTAPESLDSQTLEAFKKQAHDLGMSNAQADKLMGFYANTLAARQSSLAAASTQAQADVVTALKREWGQAYEDQLHGARRALREVGGDEMAQLLDDTKLGDHPAVIRMFAKISQQFGEANRLKGGGAGGFGQALTPAAAQSEIKALQTDAPFVKALMNRQDAGYAAAKQRWDALHLAAYPNQEGR